MYPVNYSDGVKAIQTGGVDVLLGAVVGKPEMENVAFSQPYYLNSYKLYIKKPKLEINSSFYLKSFSVTFWIFSILSLGTLSVTIWITGRIMKKINPREPNVSIPLCILAATSGVLNQGYDLGFRSYAARIQVYIALLLGVLLYSSMTAVLYSKMTIADVVFPFKSLQDVPQQNSLSLCVRNNSFVYNYFLDENKQISSEWKQTLNNHNCLDIINQTNIGRLICKDKVIILENRIVMSSFLKSNLKLTCDVCSFNQRYFRMGNIFLMTKYLLEKNKINRIMIKFMSSGVLKRIEAKWTSKQVKMYDYSTKWYQVTLDHIEGVLHFYAIMIVLSVVVLCIELVCRSDIFVKKHEWIN